MVSKYVEYMKALCEQDGLPTCDAFQVGYLTGFRQWENILTMLFGGFSPEHVVLDTGAMHTYFSLYLAQFVRSIHVTDSFLWAERSYIKLWGLQEPEEWADYMRRKGNGKLVVEPADVQKLQYPDETFDRVLSISTIEHVLDDKAGMREMWRVLKPGGVLVLSTEYFEKGGLDYNPRSYYRIYDRRSLEELLGEIVGSAHVYLDPNAGDLKRAVHPFQQCITFLEKPR